MAHSHDHQEDLSSYFTEQLFTIGLCGAIGAVTIALYAQNTLKLILAKPFHLWVLLGGIVLLALVFIRAIAVWNLAGKVKPALAHDHDHTHEHTHQHEHAHDHDHSSCGHAHAPAHQHSEALTAAPTAVASLNVLSTPPAPADPAPAHTHDHGACCQHEHDHDQEPGHNHDHDHGWAPWRYVLLLLPVALFLLNLPNEALGNPQALDAKDFDQTTQVAEKGELDLHIGFKELELAALTPDTRASYAGKTVRLTGLYAGIEEKSFTLTRYSMNCCIADAVPINAVILLDDSKMKSARLEPNRLKKKWVQVTGTVQFLNKKNTNEYMTALIVTPTPDKPLSQLVEVLLLPPANPYAD